MIHSMRTRLWLSYALLIAVVLTVAGGMVFLLVRNIPTRTAYSRLEFILTIQRQFPFDRLEPEGVAPVLLQADRLFDVRFLILNDAREVILDSRAGNSPAMVRLAPAQLRTADSGRLPRGTFWDANRRAWLFVGRPLGDGAVLLAATPRPAFRALDFLSDELLPPLAVLGGLLVILALVLSILMSRWISAPLGRMARAAREATGGIYPPIEPQGPSEVRELASAFNEMTSRVQASQKSQQDFVANVSHELKTPLTSIQGFAQALLDGTIERNQGVTEAARVIHAEAERMHRLVLELLDLAKIDSGAAGFAWADVDLAALLYHVVEKFRPQAQSADIDLSLETVSHPTLLGDGDRLAQVFSNLIENALKFTPGGGSVRIRLERIEEFAQIAVSDSGPGIPAGERDRIFERFYQTDRARSGGRDRGVGLGLAIAREIVQAHRGDISLQTSGQGSLFVVKIPLGRPSGQGSTTPGA